MPLQHWLVKQEPEDFSWDQFTREKIAAWTGVRNFAARIHLRGMKKGDLVMYYHTGDEKQVVGIAKVSKAAYPDPTREEGEWVAVDLVPVEPLRRPVTLAAIRADSTLNQTPLVKQTRLSVMPLTPKEFARMQELSKQGST